MKKENLEFEFFIQEESGVLLGNERYEGFIPDMVNIISKVMVYLNTSGLIVPS